jgi:hypothetical protein
MAVWSSESNRLRLSGTFDIALLISTSTFSKSRIEIGCVEGSKHGLLGGVCVCVWRECADVSILGVLWRFASPWEALDVRERWNGHYITESKWELFFPCLNSHERLDVHGRWYATGWIFSRPVRATRINIVNYSLQNISDIFCVLTFPLTMKTATSIVPWSCMNLATLIKFLDRFQGSNKGAVVDGGDTCKVHARLCCRPCSGEPGKKSTHDLNRCPGKYVWWSDFP